jgi:hypothetical protein
VGVGILAIVVLFLLASPTFILSPTVTFIDTELYKSSENKMPVQTKTDFGSPEVMASFPRQIGKWEGFDYDATAYIELLGANLVLIRGYLPSTFTQPLFLTIVQSKTESSFHDPKPCFSGQGYLLQEEGNDKVAMTDASWLKAASAAAVPFKKLVVTKSSKDGKLSERRVALYCYVKGNPFYSDTITMIQTEALAPLEGSYEGSLNEQKDFLAKAIPVMFSPAQTDTQWRPLAVSLIGWGPGGFSLLALLILAPVAIILYPRIRRGDLIK